jgi:hypothetical protein
MSALKHAPKTDQAPWTTILQVIFDWRASTYCRAGKPPSPQHQAKFHELLYAKCNSMPVREKFSLPPLDRWLLAEGVSAGSSFRFEGSQ